MFADKLADKLGTNFSNEAKFGVLSENNGKALRDLRKEADMTRFG